MLDFMVKNDENNEIDLAVQGGRNNAVAKRVCRSEDSGDAIPLQEQ